MNYRNIVFIMLLLPITVSSFGKSVETRIKELQEAQFKKELELSDLGEMITKKDQILNSFDDDSQYLLRLLIRRKKAILEEKRGGKKLSSEEEKQLADDLLKSSNEFLFAFFKTEEPKIISDMILNGLFHEDDNQRLKELESLRFFLIKSAFERGLVVKLVKKYEECVQELVKINQELASLKK